MRIGKYEVDIASVRKLDVIDSCVCVADEEQKRVTACATTYVFERDHGDCMNSHDY